MEHTERRFVHSPNMQYETPHILYVRETKLFVFSEYTKLPKFEYLGNFETKIQNIFGI